MAMVFCVIVVTLVLFQAPAKAQFGIYGGVALPVGDFASTDAKTGAGRALLGFGGGLEYNLSIPALPIGWATSISATYNSVDVGSAKGVEYTPWLGIWPMTGVRVSVPAFPLYAQLQAGVLIGIAPEITQTIGTQKTTYKADPAGAFGFSAGVGAGIGPVKIFARYMSGEPEFEYKFGSASEKSKQVMSVILITVGIEL